MGFCGWFQADRNDVEDQPPAKRRLLSAVVRVKPLVLIYIYTYLVNILISIFFVVCHSSWTCVVGFW